MFSRSAEYALRAVIRLARTGGWCRGREIAQDLRVPANYLSKILHQLCRRKILKSRKGWGGGFQLARSADKLRLGEVVKPFERAGEPRGCILGQVLCSDRKACPLHMYWKQITAIYRLMMEQVTVGDIMRMSPRRA